MREIKFRAWLPGIKKMTYEHTLQELMNWDTKKEDNESAIWLQYTGLKDKNGKEIYEGDIVQFITERLMGCKIFKSAVEFDDGAFIIREGTDYLDTYLCAFAGDNENQLEVIGNIYENPELLSCK